MKAVLKWSSIPLGLAVTAGLPAVALASRAFDGLVRRDVEALLAQTLATRPPAVTDDMLRPLPEPVRRYLTYTGIVGTPLVRTVRLRQKGRIRPAAGRPWMPLDAEQHYSVDPPGFVWNGTMRLGPLPLARARDMYLRGHGWMLVKAASLFTVVDGRGVEMDAGALMRYLSEMIWFPSAFLGDKVSFEAVDDTAARVTLTDQGRTATATMHFDDEGRLTELVAKRYRMVDGGYALDTWSTPVTAYGELAGLQLPVRGKAVWKLPDGDLEYIDVSVTELEYDVDSRDGASPERP
jgi:hypothetical protein